MINILFKRVKSYSWEIFLILVLLIGVFLGDGKQAGIDVYVAGVALVVFFLWYSTGVRLVKPDKKFSLVFAGIMIWTAASSFWSDGVAATIFNFQRLLLGYLFFIYGATWVKERSLTTLIKSLIWVVVTMVFISWVLVPLSLLQNQLPQMNLLYANYGHSHLADLLILFFPSVIYLAWQTKRGFWVLGSGFWVLGLISSFARAAWLIVAMSALAAIIIYRRHLSHRVKFFSLLLTSCFLLLLIGITFFGSQVKPASDGSWLGRQIVKVKPLADGRLEYWHQATVAIKERPLLGSGAGTFDLQSKRLQSQPNSYTWFTHNSFLQTWVELGLVGVLLWAAALLVLFNLLRKTLKQSNKDRPLKIALVAGLTSFVIYSLFDFVLDYLITWSLAWLLLGALTGGKSSSEPNILTKASISLTAIFYLACLIFLLNTPYLRDYSFYPPPGLDQPKEKLSPASLTRQKTALFFYARDAQVLYWSAQQADKTNDTDRANSLYQQAVIWDPQNPAYHRQLLTALINANRPLQIGPALYKYLLLVAPKEVLSTVAQDDFSSPLLFTGLIQTPQAFLPETTTPGIEAFSKQFYYLGEKTLNDDQLLAKKFWTLARDLSPQWSYFHLELASLLKWRFNDKEYALSQLGVCQNFIYPREHCRKFTPDNLPPPGSFRAEIQAIPD